MNKTLIKILFLFVGLGMLYWTVSSFGVDNYFNIILSASPIFLLLAIFTPLIEGFSAGMQLWFVYKSTDTKISLKEMFWINQWGRFISNFQKGVGIFVVIDSIAINSKISHVDSTSRFGLYYSVTMIVRAVATGLGIAYFMKLVPIEYQVFVALGILGIFLCAVFLLLIVFGSEVIKFKISEICNKLPLVNKVVNNMVQIKVTQPRSTIFYAFALATLNWLLVSAQWYFISMAIGYPIDYVFCLASVSLLSLPKLIPMLPSAFGVYDMVVAIGLSTANVPPIAGLSFAMLERITSILANSFAVLQPQYLRFFKEK
jgi:uncharacterized membrane protein YbhN (UPF0104 family)